MKTYIIRITRTDSDGTRYNTVVLSSQDRQWVLHIYKLMWGSLIVDALQGNDSLCIITFEE